MTADQQEYPLPIEMGHMIWVEYSGVRIDPSTTYKWDREGIIWRTAPSSIPREYAIQGRNLILLPPPSASAITTAPELKLRYIAVTAGLAAVGTPFLSDMDQWLAIYEAAVLYCIAHPSDENMARITGFKDQIMRRLPMAKRRSENPIEDYFPHFHVQNQRIHGARARSVKPSLTLRATSCISHAGGTYDRRRYWEVVGQRADWTAESVWGVDERTEL